jgi:ribosomal protein S24E
MECTCNEDSNKCGDNNPEDYEEKEESESGLDFLNYVRAITYDDNKKEENFLEFLRKEFTDGELKGESMPEFLKILLDNDEKEKEEQPKPEDTKRRRVLKVEKDRPEFKAEWNDEDDEEKIKLAIRYSNIYTIKDGQINESIISFMIKNRDRIEIEGITSKFDFNRSNYLYERIFNVATVIEVIYREFKIRRNSGVGEWLREFEDEVLSSFMFKRDTHSINVFFKMVSNNFISPLCETYSKKIIEKRIHPFIDNINHRITQMELLYSNSLGW